MPCKKPPDAPSAALIFPKAPLSLSAEALFRHSVISEVLGRVLGGELRDTVIGEVASRSYRVEGTQRGTSPRTVYRWLRAFATGGAAGLEPAARDKTATSEVLSERFVAFLRVEKGDDARASIPELILRARVDGVLTADEPIDRVSVWRACQRMGLPLGQRSTKKDRDSRRFAYPHRMMMMLCDGKYFRAGAGRVRRLALFFIDDATRYVMAVVVGTDGESTELFLRGLYELVRRFGKVDVLFLDNGPGFISDDTHTVVVALGMHLVLGTAGYPEGHGKIEKFNLTAWTGVLRGLCCAEIDPDPRALELRLRHFLFEQYNCRPHEALDGASPQERWDADTRKLRLPESDAELREKFVITETRKVSLDHVVPVDGIDYEVPRGHGGTRIAVRRHVLEGTLSIVHQGRLVRLHPVDLAANAAARRGKPSADHDEEQAPAPRTAAMRAFDRDYGPVVSRDGGFLEPVRDDDHHDQED
jgi:transposase InsO family protein